jgi:hypothetical protein
MNLLSEQFLEILPMLLYGGKSQFGPLLVFKFGYFIKASMLHEKIPLTGKPRWGACFHRGKILYGEHQFSETNSLGTYLVTRVACGTEPYEIAGQYLFFHPQKRHADYPAWIVSVINGFYWARGGAGPASVTGHDSRAPRLPGYSEFKGWIQLIEI